MQIGLSTAELRKKLEVAKELLAETEAEEMKLADEIVEGEHRARAEYANLQNEADEIQAQIDTADQGLKTPAKQ